MLDYPRPNRLAPSFFQICPDFNFASRSKSWKLFKSRGTKEIGEKLDTRPEFFKSREEFARDVSIDGSRREILRKERELALRERIFEDSFEVKNRIDR